jgi:hypothetical protein
LFKGKPKYRALSSGDYKQEEIQFKGRTSSRCELIGLMSGQSRESLEQQARKCDDIEDDIELEMELLSQLLIGSCECSAGHHYLG